MGRARASLAFFCALAENIERAKESKGAGKRPARKGWTRGASSNTRGRVFFPAPLYVLNSHGLVLIRDGLREDPQGQDRLWHKKRTGKRSQSLEVKFLGY